MTLFLFLIVDKSVSYARSAREESISIELISSNFNSKMARRNYQSRTTPKFEFLWYQYHHNNFHENMKKKSQESDRKGVEAEVPGQDG